MRGGGTVDFYVASSFTVAHINQYHPTWWTLTNNGVSCNGRAWLNGTLFGCFSSSEVDSAASNFLWIGAGAPLYFPLLEDYTPYDAPVSSVFDHSGNADYGDSDHQVVAFNGEASNVQTPYTGTTCYPKSDNSVFGSGFNYQGYGQAAEYYLCYNGHPGYDYAVGVGTDVYSAASGTVITAGWDSCFGNNVTIEHDNGYRTRYFHLDSIDTNNVQINQRIQAVIKIGKSGNTGSCSDGAHLHFQVEKEIEENWIPVDPYGWTGGGSDPYTRATNIDLWQ